MSENSRSVAEAPASGESLSARGRGPEGDTSSKMKTFLKQQLGNVYHWGCRFVGLEQTKEEQLVWEAIQDCMTVPESVDQTDYSPNPYQAELSVRSSTLSHPSSPSSVSPSMHSTGRDRATPTDKLKPDILPLIASGIMQSIQKRKLEKSKKKGEGKKGEGKKGEERSFTALDDDDDDDDDQTIRGVQQWDFFGPDNNAGGADYPDSAMSSIWRGSPSPGVHSLERRNRMAFAGQDSLKMEQQTNPERLYRNVSGWWYKIQSLEGLLYLKRRGVPSKYQDKVRRLEQGVKRRPYFTYWLMFVNMVILLVTLSVYGFAPYGWDLMPAEALVQRSSLALEVATKNVTGNVWGGPSLEALVLLGAKYAPCMRRDRQLYSAIESDWVNESNNSGCCVRRDKSGCVQVLSAADCLVNFADFIYQYNETSAANVRAVCGTSPYTCTDPSKAMNPNWNSPSISNWPICLAAGVSSASHLTCELTGRPCCVGILAVCLITTREHCDFLGGHFNQTAFLCSQVDCLSAVCGMLPFGQKNQPDQVYRLWLSLFLHAGIVHIILTLLFDFLILRIVEKKLGWFRTLLLYVLSGTGGNIFSAVFVPYYPEVGPGSSIFGVIAYIFIFVIMESTVLERVWRHIAVMSSILLIALVLGVLLPILDNFAHVGGFLFGIFLSFIFVQYLELRPELDPKRWGATFYKVKCVMVPVSIVMLILLYISSLVWFYKGQENLYGFTYFNCVPYTGTFCVYYGQNLERVQILP